MDRYMPQMAPAPALRSTQPAAGQTTPPSAFPVGMAYVPHAEMAANLRSGTGTVPRDHLPRPGSSFYDGEVPVMNYVNSSRGYVPAAAAAAPTSDAAQILRALDQASFALDEVLLYLDTPSHGHGGPGLLSICEQPPQPGHERLHGPVRPADEGSGAVHHRLDLGEGPLALGRRE